MEWGRGEGGSLKGCFLQKNLNIFLASEHITLKNFIFSHSQNENIPRPKQNTNYLICKKLIKSYFLRKKQSILQYYPIVREIVLARVLN